MFGFNDSPDNLVTSTSNHGRIVYTRSLSSGRVTTAVFVTGVLLNMRHQSSGRQYSASPFDLVDWYLHQ